MNGIVVAKKIAWTLAFAAMLFWMTGCTSFESALSIEQAVARLVPFDPPNSQADHLIGDDEIELAFQLWVREEVVPKTGGKRIDDLTMKRLEQRWAQQAFIP